MSEAIADDLRFILGEREDASPTDRRVHYFPAWEIAVFDYPLQPDVSFVKRVVGLPGERVDGDDLAVGNDCRRVRRRHRFR